MRRLQSINRYLIPLLGIALFLLTVQCTEEKIIQIKNPSSGKFETILHYNSQGKLIRLERDMNGDGGMDWIDEYRVDAQSGQEWLAANLIDLDGDRRFETTVEHYQQNNKVNVKRDRNGDGKVDVEAEFNFDVIGAGSGFVRRDDNFDGKFETTGTSLSIL